MQNRFTFYSRIVVGLLLMPIVLLMPRMRRKMVFGAWFGDSFSDNPKYFLKYMLSIGGWHCVWVGNAHLRGIVGDVPGVEFVEKGSMKALWHCLTAKYFVNNIIWMNDIMAIPSCGRIVQINLWHGTALKRIGHRQYNGNGEIVFRKNKRLLLRRWLGKLILRLNDYMYPMQAYSSSGSQRNAKVLQESWPRIFSPDRMCLAGQPRCDFLLGHMNDKAFLAVLKVKFAKMFGVSARKKWYLYLPTWRHDLRRTYSFASCKNESQLEETLNMSNAIIIEKQHPKVLWSIANTQSSSSNVYIISGELANQIDVQELLLVADRLITDYSSCYFDYELLERPIIHFDYDYHHYINSDSGVEYDPREVCGGPVVFTEKELLETLAMDDNDLKKAKGRLADELIDLETGHSAQALYEMIPK